MEEFPGLCGLLALSALGNMVHYFVMAIISGSHCPLCLGVAYGVRLGDAMLGSPVDGLRRVWVLPVSKIDFCGDATGAILGSPVDACSASASRGSLTNFIFCSIVSVLTQNGEVCPS